MGRGWVESGGSKAWTLVEQQWITEAVRGFESGPKKMKGERALNPEPHSGGGGVRLIPFDLQPLNTPSTKATCANCALWYSGFPVSDHLFADSPGQRGQAGWQRGGCELTMNGAIRRARHREALTFLGCLLLINSVRWDKIEGRPLLTPQSHTHGSLSLFLMARTTSVSSHSNKDRRWIYCWTEVSCHRYFHPKLSFSNSCRGNGWRFDIFVAWELIFVQIQSSANQMKNNNMCCPFLVLIHFFLSPLQWKSKETTTTERFHSQLTI